MRSVCELALHPQQQPKRMAHSAALLTSCFALLLSIILWSNVRAGCRAEAMALAADGGAEALGMLGGSDAGIGSELPGGGSMEQQLREQQQRVRDLEIILADERSEAQTIRFERASLVREKEQAEQQRQEAERDKQVLLTEAQSALYADSLVMGHLIRANRTALKRDWQARLAGQRQRGIVLSAGSTLPLTNAFITLHVLRNHLKCALPVAIMYWGASKADTVDNSSIAFFKEHLRDVEFINASALAYPDYHRPLSPDLPNGAFQGWKVKVFSIYAAPFQEVLYLDSDSTPLLDPSTLFATEQYRRFGNLFWADFYAGDVPWIKAEKLFEILKVESPWSPARGPKTARQAETGQLLLHRGWHWEVLEWLLFLNTHDEVTYRTAHGDKDTFRAAFHLAGRAGMYQQVAHYPALTLTDTVVKERRYHQRGVVQLHPNGSLLFHHKAGPLGKFDLQRLEPIPATTHVTARASADLGTACVFSGSLVNEAIGGMYEKQVLLVTPSTCNYTMYDWPASQAACAPGYDQNLPGTTQKLPIFEVTPTSHLARAEAAAEAAFNLMESSRIWGPEILTVFGTWGPDV